MVHWCPFTSTWLSPLLFAFEQGKQSHIIFVPLFLVNCSCFELFLIFFCDFFPSYFHDNSSTGSLCSNAIVSFKILIILINYSIECRLTESWLTDRVSGCCVGSSLFRFSSLVPNLFYTKVYKSLHILAGHYWNANDE